MKQGTKKQSTRKSLHPLDVLLQDTTDDSKSMIGALAQRYVQIAREKEPGGFTETISNKIERLRFASPDSRKDGRSFHVILKRAGVLEKFLSRSLQREVEKWMLLRDILKADRTDKKEHKSYEGLPTQFHRSLMTALLEHLDALEEIARKYNSQRSIEKHYSAVRKEFVRNAKLLISFNCPPSWPMLFGESKLNFSPRDEEVSIRARVFRALETQLQTPRSKEAGISDQFLWQLTELISGADTEGQLRRDRIRYAVKSRRSPGNSPAKSQKT